MIGQTISHYKILEKIGEGGMGVVYKAEDTKLKRTVALKFLSPQILKNKDEKIRFSNEAQSAAAINHAHVTTIYEINDHEDQTYISMEYVDGKTLKEIIQEHSKLKIQHSTLSIERIIDITTQICNGLKEAHEKGIIHRDIKSDNIMVTDKGQVKIMDFGLAKLKGQPGATKMGTTMGTVNYMSPEQAMGKEIDHRTDIWSLGIVMYEMATGDLPFKGDYEQAIIYAILNEKPKPISELNPNIPDDLEQLIDKLLIKDPDKRIQSVDSISEKLKSPKEKTRPEKTSQIKKDAQSFSRLFRLSLLTVFILAAVMTAYFLFKGKSSPPEPTKTTTKAVWTNSIAVLPFLDLSPSRDQEYFCDGMTEDIITKLTHIRELKVISRTSVMRFKNTKKDIKEIGKELGVDTVLEGSIRKEGDNIRVSAQLINIADGFHLWADTFDRKLASVFEVQENVSRSIAQALKLRFTPEMLKTEKPENIEAYEYYLKAGQMTTSYVLTRKEEDFIQAKNLLNKALEKDSDYALAHIGLAWAYANHFEVTKKKEDLPLIEIHIRKGYDLNPDISESNIGMAWLSHLKNDHASTSQFIKKSLRLNPNIASNNLTIAYILERVGLEDKAVKHIIKAIELNPLYVFAPMVLARCYRETGNWKKAEEQHLKTLSLDPDSALFHLSYYYFLTLTRQFEKAQQEIKVAEELDPDYPYLSDFKALRYAAQGKKDLALKTLKEPYDKVFALLGMKDKAINALKQEIKTYPRGHSYLHLLNNPCYDNLRDDPRFKKILEERKEVYQKMQKIFKDL